MKSIDEGAMPLLAPIYVLTLPRYQKRRDFMESSLASLGVDFSLIEGVDGFNLSEDAVFKSQQASMRIGGQPLTPGEVGCAMGHMKIYRKFLESEHRFALILEDDVKIGRALKIVVNHLISTRFDFDYINFVSDNGEKIIQDLTDIYSLTHFTASPNRASCYLISRLAAETFLEFEDPIRYGADTLTGEISFARLNSFGITPRVAQLQDVPSTIQGVYFNEKSHKLTIRIRRLLSRLLVVIPDAFRNF